MGSKQLITDPALANYVLTIKELHKRWVPHAGQIKCGHALFGQGKKSIFVQCGRKWGKTEFALYVMWRWARLNPGSRIYYIAPYLKQAREIVWADPRIVNFGPRSWLLPGSKGVNNSEMRLNFTNGSFIKIDGSDNFDSHRGTRPSLIIYEEFKDHRPEFRIVMRPNLAVCDAPEIFIGTPPEMETDFQKVAQEHIDDPKNKLYYEAPTYDNPLISRAWLEAERKRLYDRDEGDYWEREYMGRYVPGGQSKIFPMLSKKLHMAKSHEEMLRAMADQRKSLDWYVLADPAASSVFAVLLAALNRYTKHWYYVGEIYETRLGHTSMSKIGPRIINLRDNTWSAMFGANPKIIMQGSDASHVYDEAEAWFAQEWLDAFPNQPAFMPTHKALNDKDVGVSLIKDSLLGGLVTMSPQVPMLFHEMDHYHRDKNGRIPKGKDHQIDNVRYGNGHSNYNCTPEAFIAPEDDENFRGATPEDDFREIRGDDETMWREYSIEGEAG